MEKRTQQGKLTNLEIASFCSEMAMILKSGISALEGVDRRILQSTRIT